MLKPTQQRRLMQQLRGCGCLIIRRWQWRRLQYHRRLEINDHYQRGLRDGLLLFWILECFRLYAIG